MQTSARESPSASQQRREEVPPETADTAWNPLYRVGGAAALMCALMYLLAMVIYGFARNIAPPRTVLEWFTLLQDHPLTGLFFLGLADIAIMVFWVPMTLALSMALKQCNKTWSLIGSALVLIGVAVYLATNMAFSLLSLSHQYTAATTAAEKTTLIAAGQSMMAVSQGTGGQYLGMPLAWLAGLMLSVVMLRSTSFSKVTAWAGILGLGFLLVSTPFAGYTTAGPTTAIVSAIVAVSYIGGGVLSLVWYILVGRGLLRLAQVGLQAAVQSPEVAETSGGASSAASEPHRRTSQPQEIAPGVHCLEVGKGIMRSNVYFVRSGSSWVLIDTASAKCDLLIQEAAESLFGANIPPTAILLTHDHPDHAGSTRELARRWGCLVYVHPDELELCTMSISTYLSTVKKYANPLDRWVILPLLRILPKRARASLLAESSFKDAVRAFDPGADVPGLLNWECFPTPGHTRGHVSFFRPCDRVLIAGDAVLTVHLNAFWSFLLWGFGRTKQRLSGPPWYTTWSWQAAKKSVASLVELEPRVLACGHGLPMSGSGTAPQLRAFAEHFR